MNVIVWVARIIVAGVFGLFAIGKIEDPIKFAEQIQNYRMMPLEWTHAMAFALPWLEVVAAALLLIGLWRAEARYWILFMLVGFTVAKLYVEIIQGRHIDCGCAGGILKDLFGASAEKVLAGWNGIYLNLFLIVLLLTDAVFSPARRRTPRISVEGVSPAKTQPVS